MPPKLFIRGGWTLHTVPTWLNETEAFKKGKEMYYQLERKAHSHPNNQGHHSCKAEAGRIEAFLRKAQNNRKIRVPQPLCI